MGLIINDQKHFLRTETSQKYLVKTLYFNKKDTSKVKDFQKFSNKKICLILQSNKHQEPFKFILGSNFLEGHHILSPEIQVKVLLIGLTNSLMDIYFLTTQYIEWATNQIFWVPNVKNEKSITPFYILLQAVQNYSRLQ